MQNYNTLEGNLRECDIGESLCKNYRGKSDWV